MTKFILHGGETSRDSVNNVNFFKEMLVGFSGEVKVICAYFSRPKEQWEGLLESDKKRFEAVLGGRKLKLEIANDNLGIFEEQVKEADVLYFRGGSNELLEERLKGIKNLKELLKDRVVAGSSAGASLLSRYYFTRSKNRIEEGLGIIQIKVFVHYLESYENNLEKLRKYKEELETITIPETEFVVKNYEI